MNISLHKKYKDGYGRAVRILEIDTEISDEYPVRGVVFPPSGRGSFRSWTADGRWWNDGEPRKDDLVEVVESPQPEPKAPALVATAPQWKTGAVKLVNGWDATIHRYCEHRKRYIGEARDKDGWFFAGEWGADGSWSFRGSPCNDLNLAPPPKKTVWVQRWIVVYFDGSTAVFFKKEKAVNEAKKNGFALLEIDREVEEGEGL